MDRDENMTTQMSGNKTYKDGGTITGLSVNLMKAKAFSAGRRTAESHRPNRVLSPSSIIENSAKLTENRLSMISTRFFQQSKQVSHGQDDETRNMIQVAFPQ